jgi:hypothetical protein
MRLERALERLGELRELFALRIAQLQQAQHRIGELTAQGIDRLDELDGDPDLEPTLGWVALWGDQTRLDLRDVDEREDVSEDEGAACEDEGFKCDDEHDGRDFMCNWQDEGDQTVLKRLPVYTKRVPGLRSQHQNVGPLVRVRVVGPSILRPSGRTR